MEGKIPLCANKACNGVIKPDIVRLAFHTPFRPTDYDLLFIEKVFFGEDLPQRYSKEEIYSNIQN